MDTVRAVRKVVGSTPTPTGSFPRDLICLQCRLRDRLRDVK